MQCDSGDCCSNCLFLPLYTKCRETENQECGLSEYCSGVHQDVRCCLPKLGLEFDKFTSQKKGSMKLILLYLESVTFRNYSQLLYSLRLKIFEILGFGIAN